MRCKKIQISVALVCLLLIVFECVYMKSLSDGQSEQYAAERFCGEGVYEQWTVIPKSDMTHSDAKQLCTNTLTGILEQYASDKSVIYSLCGTDSLYLQTPQRSYQAQVYVTGGEFFFFHEMKLADGCFYQDDDLMQDGIVIDERCAWELFGASNVAGLPVVANGITLFIRGVVCGDEGRAYVSYGNEAFQNVPVMCMEYVLPDSLSQTAEKTVELLADSSLVECSYFCNSNRFFINHILENLSDYWNGRSNNYGEEFYWEQEARTAENRSLLLVVCMPFEIILMFGGFAMFFCHGIKQNQRLFL